MIAGALLFISWDVVLGPVYASSSVSTFAQIVGLAYPISDIAMVTIVVLTLSRLHVGQRLPPSCSLRSASYSMPSPTVSSAFLTTLQSYTSVNLPRSRLDHGIALIGLAALRR